MKNKIKNNIKIERSNVSHIENLAELEKLCFSIPTTKDMLKREIENNNAYYLSAFFRNNLIGYVGLLAIVDEGQIMNIAVNPKFRNLGVASLLLKNVILFCLKKKIHDITLEVRKTNIAALNLYNKFGFKKEGLRKAYYEDNKEDAIIMWKRI
jgi:ribosomal-protein-alanine N-acetyltransferase